MTTILPISMELIVTAPEHSIPAGDQVTSLQSPVHPEILISRPSINAQPPSNPQQRKPICHAQTIPQHIKLATLNFLPPNRDLHYRDARQLSQHQHLDIEDPAFAMHEGDNIWQRRAREELEPALRVADGGCCGGCEESEEEVKGVHEEVAEERALFVIEVSVY